MVEWKVSAQTVVDDDAETPAIHFTIVLDFADDFWGLEAVSSNLECYLPTKSLDPRMVVMNSSSLVTEARPKSEIFRSVSLFSSSRLSGYSKVSFPRKYNWRVYLKISVCDTELMTEIESIHDRLQVADSLLLGQKFVLCDGLAQGSSLHELEDQIELLVFEYFDESHNVRVGNFTENLDFLE